jgi:hypothetical protein
MLGFTAEADAVTSPTEVAIGDYALVIDDAVSVRAEQEAPTAKFEGPVESVVRLISGRLKPERTPDGVQVTGNVSLVDLRRVFPGY